MRDKVPARLGLVAMFLLAAGIAAYSARYYGALAHVWLDVDPKIRAVIAAARVQALAHMLVSPVALVLGPLQFAPGLRAERPALHRWTGRVYVVACLVGGVGALATTPYASGGPVAGFGFAVLAVLWLASTLAAWWAAVSRDFSRHRLLMRFSYAMTFGAVTLRLQIPIGFALGFRSYSAMSVWLAYTSWIPNVIAVALYSARRARRRPAASLPA